MKKLKFNWLNIQKLPEDVHGIYSIWSRTTCIYIGKAQNQSLKKRLLQHYSRCHNEKLKAWINSAHQLWFGVEPVTNMGSIDAKEQLFLIEKGERERGMLHKVDGVPLEWRTLWQKMYCILE